MTVGAVSIGDDGCPCRPKADELPVALLNASVHYPQFEPSLLTVTVDYELGLWRSKALATHVLEWVLDFALRRDERSGLAAGRAMAIARRAVKATFGNGHDRGVPGEILLHAVCRQFYGSDTVINKVMFKTADNDTYKGFDAVHCVHNGDTLELWLGEAKFYKDVNDAIRAAILDLQNHLTADYLKAEFALVAEKIDNSHPHADELRQLMHPTTSLDTVFGRIVVPVLVSYDSATTIAHNHTCPEYDDALEKEVRAIWTGFAGALPSPLPVTVRLILVPLATKAALLTALEEELAPWL